MSGKPKKSTKAARTEAEAAAALVREKESREAWVAAPSGPEKKHLYHKAMAAGEHAESYWCWAAVDEPEKLAGLIKRELPSLKERADVERAAAKHADRPPELAFLGEAREDAFLAAARLGVAVPGRTDNPLLDLADLSGRCTPAAEKAVVPGREAGSQAGEKKRRAGGGMPRLDKECQRVYDGARWYDVSPRQLEMLSLLFEAKGGWVSGKSIDRRRRFDKVRKAMPLGVRRMVESHQTNGYRIPALLPK